MPPSTVQLRTPTLAPDWAKAPLTVADKAMQDAIRPIANLCVKAGFLFFAGWEEIRTTTHQDLVGSKNNAPDMRGKNPGLARQVLWRDKTALP